MKEHPILFSTEMVKAILEGRKTQTRRVIKTKQPPNVDDTTFRIDLVNGYEHCPYGQVGDRLWVRETWATMSFDDETPPSEVKKGNPIWYCDTPGDAPTNCGDDRGKWRPSIFMPRWASRITLEITSVRVQRVQEISEEDAIAEGIVKSSWECNIAPYRSFIHTGVNAGRSLAAAAYMDLWDSINRKRKVDYCTDLKTVYPYSWAANPWVWVIEFKRIDK